jgi:hypothetical protein
MGLTTVVSGSEAVRTNVAFVSGDFLKYLACNPLLGAAGCRKKRKSVVLQQSL